MEEVMASYGTITGITGSRKIISFLKGISLATAMALVFPLSVIGSSNRFVDSDDYKDKGFTRCNISDYADMVKGDDVDWVWASPSQKLSQYNLKVGSAENKSDLRSKSLVEAMKSTFKDNFADRDIKENKGTLTADLCIYEVQNFNPAKAWIPFAGGHQMQAGVGVEMVLVDESGKTVAKFRHFARRGTVAEAAVEEVAGDLTKYIRKH